MKNKLRILFKYLKGMGIDELKLRVDLENGIQYLEYDTQYDISSAMDSIVNEIIEIYEDDLYELGPGNLDNPNDYFTVEVKILPSENKFIFTEIDYQGYETEGSGSYYDINDYEEGQLVYDYFIEVRKFLDEIGSDSVTINYSGGGDSGAVDNDYESENGSGMVPNKIEDICYNLLEEYGGWEINEGSQGNIVFTKDDIDINHEWNIQEDYNEEVNIVITPETFTN